MAPAGAKAGLTMTLREMDELRHTPGDDYHWRESLYFNFNDTVHRIGGWIYLWLLPNQPLPAGMLVAFYHLGWPSLSINEASAASPGHRITDGERWIYCFQQNIADPVADDFDDFSLCGLRLRRLEPLQRYALSFEDDCANGFDLECRFMTPPFDYADGVNPTPPWMAANRYHRAHAIAGQLRIAGARYPVGCTGDSDHSWGQRDMGVFGDNLFKMWSMQARDGRLAVSVIQQGVGTTEVALGFVSVDGELASARTISSSARYDAKGVQSGIELRVEDDHGRELRAKLAFMHSYVGWGSASQFWGYEGVGDFEVEGYGTVPGLTSYFWPSRVTPDALQAGKWR